MKEIQDWLMGVGRVVLDWLAGAWHALARGVMHEWSIGYFIAGMSLLLVVGLVTIWYRGAR